MATITKKRPAQQKAQSYLLQAIENAKDTGIYRLQTYQKLAREAGVSPVTLLRALKELEKRNLLKVSHGTGITIPSPVHAPTRLSPVVRKSSETQPDFIPDAPAEQQPKWLALSLRIRNDILHGAYAPGTDLPSHKEIMCRYGVCYRTLHRALQHLENDRIIGSHRKGWRVPVISSRGFAHTILLFAVADTWGNLEPFTQRTLELIRTLERECRRVQINLSTVPFDFRAGRFLLPDGSTDVEAHVARIKSVLGSLVWTVGIPENVLADLHACLARSEKPVSLLDETGNTDLKLFCRGSVRGFTMSTSPLCGSAAARYLLAQGHRDAVYISPFQDSVWSRGRFAGAAQTFRDAGLPGGVNLVACDEDHHRAQAQDISGPAVDKAMTNLLRVMLRPEGDKRPLPAQAREKMGSHVTSVTHIELLRERVQPLLESALGHTGATAWIGANDSVALECLAFLRAHRRNVPADVSVIGFDDTIEAFSQHLTSYSFNIPAVINAMLAHVLSPRRSGLGSPDKIVEVEGMVVERETTGRRK